MFDLIDIERGGRPNPTYPLYSNRRRAANRRHAKNAKGNYANRRRAKNANGNYANRRRAANRQHAKNANGNYANRRHAKNANENYANRRHAENPNGNYANRLRATNRRHTENTNGNYTNRRRAEKRNGGDANRRHAKRKRKIRKPTATENTQTNANAKFTENIISSCTLASASFLTTAFRSDILVCIRRLFLGISTFTQLRRSITLYLLLVSWVHTLTNTYNYKLNKHISHT